MKYISDISKNIFVLWAIGRFNIISMFLLDADLSFRF